MAAAMNGIAAHGGLIPYGGTFLCFSDYCRPSIRLSAFSRLGVVYVMTHDSIGLGEDGPTHQPVEHLAALRAMPGLYLYRPADAVETAECWALAIERRDAPSLLALTRQAVPLLRRDPAPRNRSRQGGYVLAEAEGGRRVTLIASGSEVAIAMAARDLLLRDGIGAAVVSLPCWRLFEEASGEYRDRVLGPAPRVAVEAAVAFGWERWLGPHGAFVGMTALAPRPRARRSTSILASRRSGLPPPPARSYRGGARIGRREHDDTGCDQWLRPDRPAGVAGGL
jgi:transketolase